MATSTLPAMMLDTWTTCASPATLPSPTNRTCDSATPSLAPAPDGDLYANILEFVFATSPGDPNDKPDIKVTETAEAVELSFKGSSELGDVRVTLEQSPDLISPWVDSGIAPEITPDGRFMDDYKFTVPTTGDGVRKARYYRIKASTTGQ